VRTTGIVAGVLPPECDSSQTKLIYSVQRIPTLTVSYSRTTASIAPQPLLHPGGRNYHDPTVESRPLYSVANGDECTLNSAFEVKKKIRCGQQSA